MDTVETSEITVDNAKNNVIEEEVSIEKRLEIQNNRANDIISKLRVQIFELQDEQLLVETTIIAPLKQQILDREKEILIANEQIIQQKDENKSLEQKLEILHEKNEVNLDEIQILHENYNQAKETIATLQETINTQTVAAMTLNSPALLSNSDLTPELADENGPKNSTAEIIDQQNKEIVHLKQELKKSHEPSKTSNRHYQILAKTKLEVKNGQNKLAILQKQYDIVQQDLVATKKQAQKQRRLKTRGKFPAYLDVLGYDMDDLTPITSGNGPQTESDHIILEAKIKKINDNYITIKKNYEALKQENAKFKKLTQQ